MNVRCLFLALLVGLAGIAAADAQEFPEGKSVFDRNCSHCHAPGREHPGTLQLAVTRGDDKAVLEDRADLTPEYIRYIVRHGLRAMPPFVPADIPDDQLDALAEYLSH